MAEIDALVQKNIQLFLNKLRTSGISINQAYLFGSFVTGSSDKWSDIDDRLKPLPFNLKTFSNDDPFVRKIIKTGLSVN